jgi:hypothetical protein
MCQNIDDFNRACALIFARLYREFPRPVMLDVAALDDGDDLMEEERAARMADRLGVAAAAMQFLADEGYLVFRDSRVYDSEARFSGARLTSKGLMALNRVPASIRPPGKTAGDTLVDLARGIAVEGAREAAKTAIRTILGG